MQSLSTKFNSLRYGLWRVVNGPEILMVTALGLCVKWTAHMSHVRNGVHSKIHSIAHVATKVHKTLQSFVVLTWMRDAIELV